MKNHFKYLLEPIGLAILLVAFVWQMRSVYMNQSIQNDKIYKFERQLTIFWNARWMTPCEIVHAIKERR